jgi:hypothetical protein
LKSQIKAEKLAQLKAKHISGRGSTSQPAQKEKSVDNGDKKTVRKSLVYALMKENNLNVGDEARGVSEPAPPRGGNSDRIKSEGNE